MRVITSALAVTLLSGLISISGFAQPLNKVSLPSTSSAQINCLQPPSVGNISQLNDAQLMSYGLPIHSIIERSPSNWITVFQHVQHRDCGVGHRDDHPSKTVNTYSCPNPVSPGNICYLANWAGNNAETSSRSRYVFRDATVEFIVPTISTSDSQAQVSEWAGVGGNGFITSPSVLVQAGVDSYVSNGQQHNTAWWEVVPGFNMEDFTALTVNRGDSMYVDIESNYANTGYDYFFVDDFTSNHYATCVLPTTSTTTQDTCLPGYPGGPQFNSDGAGGECIVERPSVNNVPVHLAQFNAPNNTLTITQCETNGTAIGNQSHFDDTMVNTSGTTILAKPGPIYNSGESFVVTWMGSH